MDTPINYLHTNHHTGFTLSDNDLRKLQNIASTISLSTGNYFYYKIAHHLPLTYDDELYWAVYTRNLRRIKELCESGKANPESLNCFVVWIAAKMYDPEISKYISGIMGFGSLDLASKEPSNTSTMSFDDPE